MKNLYQTPWKKPKTDADGIEIQLNTVMDTSEVIQQMSGSTQQVAANTTETAKVAEKTLKVNK